MESALKTRNCLGDDELIALVEGRLAGEQLATVERHIDGCTACLRLVAALAHGELSGESSSTAGGGRTGAEAPVPRGRLGRYELREAIGAGGMGLVYAARDPELDREVAVKILRPGKRGSVEGQPRLLREARAMAKLSHPNVVAVYDVGTSGDSVFVAMELVVGETLTAWLARSHSAREIVGAFVEAGRGLAAAHAAGLVHRDFKPENAMIDRSGRVRVMDFGLAWAQAEETTEPDQRGEPTELGSSFAGTPLYMAPEQHLGQADARSDQFAFCVALYRALFGTHPFAGDGPTAWWLAASEGRVSIPPQRRGVAARVVRAVLRGLSADPEARWPSMDALVDALRPRATARTWLVALPIVVIAAFALRPDEPTGVAASACDDLQTIVDGAWGAERRASVQARLSAEDDRGAGASADRVVASVDAWFDEWATAYRDACEAIDRGADSARAECLRAHTREMGALLDEIRVDKPISIEAVSHAVATQAPPERCDDATSVEESPVVAELRERFDRVRAQLLLGRYGEAMVAARELVVDAEAAGDVEFLCNAEQILAELANRLNDFAEAEAVTERTYYRAVTIGRHDLAARAAASLVGNLGQGQGRLDDALRWGRHAQLEAELADRDDLRMVTFSYLAMVHAERGELAVAIELQLWSHAFASTLPPDHRDRATSLYALATLYQQAGKPEEAERHIRAAAEQLERMLGADNPDLAQLRANRAMILDDLGRRAEAIALMRESLAVIERAVGPDHPLTGRMNENLGLLLGRAGDHETAVAHISKALALSIGQFGEDHPEVASARLNLASILSEAGRAAEARDEALAALGIYEASRGTTHDGAGRSHIVLAQAYIQLREPVAAVKHGEAAVEATSAVLQNVYDVALARFTLARALMRAGRQRARAIDLARQAAAAMATLGPLGAAERAEYEAWLAEHDRRRR